MSAVARTLARPVIAGLATAIGVMAVGACAPYRVHTDFDPDAGFTELRTYAWTDSTRAARDTQQSPFLERRVRRAVDNALGDRGFRTAPAGAADFLITAFVVEPSRAESRWRVWQSAPCPPMITVHFSFRYPYGFSPRRSWYRFWDPYLRDPWGYACAYRVGFGHMWIPVYEDPGDRLPGTLVIDVLRPADHELIWRGWAEGALYAPGGRSATQEELDDIVARILKEFPPR